MYIQPQTATNLIFVVFHYPLNLYSYTDALCFIGIKMLYILVPIIKIYKGQEYSRYNKCLSPNQYLFDIFESYDIYTNIQIYN